MEKNSKQKLFENLIKLNPELKESKLIKEEFLNEADNMEDFLATLGFKDMYYQYKDNPSQMERVFTRILKGRNLKTFLKLLHPEGVPEPDVSTEPERQAPTLEDLVNALPNDFGQKMKRLIDSYGEDIIDDFIENEIENIGGEIGITNKEEADELLNQIIANPEKFVTLVNGKYDVDIIGWGGRNVQTENDAFNDAGEPRMTHQQYRDYSEPSEPDYDSDRDMPQYKTGIGNFNDIDWKTLHGILVQNTNAAQQGKLNDVVTVNDLTDYDGYLTSEELKYLDAWNIVYNDPVHRQWVGIDDDQYLDFNTFYNKAKEVWGKEPPYSGMRDDDDSEAPYMRGYEPMDEGRKLFEMMSKIDPTYKKKLNEVDYQTAKAGENEYKARIEQVLSEFKVSQLEFTRWDSAVVARTDVSVVINTYQKENPYQLSIRLTAYGGGNRDEIMVISLYEGITPDKVVWVVNGVEAGNDTIDFVERFIRTAAQYAGITDERIVDQIIGYARQKLSEKRV